MAEPTLDPEVREAQEELQQYLSDTVPPLVVADSVNILLKCSPQIIASNIHAWTTAQYRRGAAFPLSDYLFHAVKKIHLMWEFHLVPREPFQQYMDGLKEIVLGFCPPEDRELLKGNLDRLGEAPTALNSPVDVLFRASGGPAGAVGTLTSGRGEAGVPSEGFRRLGLLLERLERDLTGFAAGVPPETRSELAAEALAAAARGSGDRREFEYSLDRLKKMGIGAGTDEVFRALGRSLPGWMLPEGAAPGHEDSNLKAMRRIVSEAEDPAEGASRFQQMVKAAVDRFNEGSLPQAVSMLELAERLISEKKVDPGIAQIVRRKADEGLDPERLRRYAESADQHAVLRRVLSFFSALMPEGLLSELQRELKRERRRLLLLLLEIHGAPARAAAFEKLHLTPGRAAGEEEWYFRRNLLYLLRRIPRPEEAPLDEEVELVARHCEPRFPAPLLKEAIASLGQLKHEKAERTLSSLLADLEGMLVKPGEAPYDTKELSVLLDRVGAALARFGTPTARRAVVDHALKRKAELGDTMARLAELAGQDFSDDPGTVERLLAALRSNLPFKIFGLVLQQNDQNLQYLIETLSATPLTKVREALQDVASRYPDQPFGRAAAKALSGLGQAAPPPEAPAASLSGDLEIFGLPGLLQSLADSGVSGSLGLKDPKGGVFGILALKAGKLLSCQVGALQGDEAFYQLLERPAPGTFHFTRTAAGGSKDAAPREPDAGLRDILPLSLEGMRRYDELQQARALVPDEMLLRPTSVKPTPHPDERDGMLVNTLWTAVSKGATPLQCEAGAAADSYRIRRLLTHWVDMGALATG